MASCKDCIHYDICCFHLKGNENERCVQFLPTADVVPRAEVERLQAQIAQLQLDLHYSVCREDKAKTEVAREIFEEIERIFDGKKYVPYPLYEIAELKKKYTEGVKNAEKNTDL